MSFASHGLSVGGSMISIPKDFNLSNSISTSSTVNSMQIQWLACHQGDEAHRSQHFDKG